MASFRVGAALKELRIHLCQTSATSQGVRDFITNHYVSLKKANPELPILVRECAGAQARVWARYDKGCELSESLEGVDTQRVLDIITGLAKL